MITRVNRLKNSGLARDADVPEKPTESSNTAGSSGHKGLRVLQCTRCGFCSNDEDTLGKHIKSIHGVDMNREDSGGGGLLKCTECEYSSTNKHCLKQHYDLVHVAERPFKCPFCNYAGKRSHSLKEHLVVHSSTPPYKCSLCNACFRKKGHLTNHVRLHSKKFECKSCKLKLNSQEELVEHMATKHVSHEVYICELCGFATSEKNTINDHMVSHGCLPVYGCDNCSFQSPNADSLKEHLENTQHGSRDCLSLDVSVQLKCSQCGFSTRDNECLKEHMLAQHTSAADGYQNNPGNTYKCSECSFSCGKAHLYFSHILSHKIYEKANSKQESVCVSSGSSSDLNFTHDASIGLYKCNICGYLSEHQRSIKTHIWKHSGHKDIDYPMFQNGPLSVYDDSPVGDMSVDECSLQSGLAVSRTNSGSVSICVDAVEAQEEGNLSFEKHKVRHMLQCAWCDTVVFTVSALEKHLELVHKIKEKIYLPEDIDPSKDSSSDTTDSVPELALLKNDTETSSHEEIQKINKSKKMYVFHNDGADVGNEVEVAFHEPGTESWSETESLDNTPVVLATVSETSPQAAKRKAEDADVNDKRPCLDGACHTGSVVVQQLPQIHTALSFEDQAEESSRVSSPQLSRASSRESLNEDQSTQLPMKPRTRCQSANSLEFVNLLALLKKGPNRNSEHPPSALKRASTDSKRSESSDAEDCSSKTERKPGICSSLLAVIEHLRERAKSESDGENSQDNPHSTSGNKKRRSRRGSLEDADLENLQNVEHIQEEVEGDIRLSYRCKLCHYTNSSPALIKTHMRLHKAKQPYECSLCDFVASSSEQLQDHMLQHCKVRVYQCKLCPSKFHYKSQLRAHMRAHDRGQYTCKHCNFETTSAMVYRSHILSHSQQSFDGEQIDSDQDSSGGYRSNSQAENLSPIFKCLKCDKTFVHKDELLAHNHDEASVSSSQEDDPRTVLKCTICEFSTSDLDSMKQHANSHQRSSLRCDLCDFEAISMRSLKSHMKRHANDQRFVQQPLEQYKCNLCGYVCHHLPSLKSHMWRHASDTNYSYQKTNDIINAAIDYDITLPSHLEKVTSLQIQQRPTQHKASETSQVNCLVTFRCCQCGFESANKGELHSHMKEHMDIIQKTMEIAPYPTQEDSTSQT